MNEATYDRLIKLIYEAALEPLHWQNALIELADALQADAFHLLGWDVQINSDVIGVMSEYPCSSTALESYQRYYGKIDPRRRLAASLQPGQAIACHQHFDESFVRRSEFFQDYLGYYGLRYSMGGCLHRDDKLDVQLGLVRISERGPFSAKEQRLLVRLMPHFGRAVQLMLRGETLARQSEISQFGADFLPFAVIALDRFGRPVHCNCYAETLLRAGRILTLRGGRLRAVNARQNEQLSIAFKLTQNTSHPNHLLLSSSTMDGVQERFSLALINSPRHGPFAMHNQTVVLCLIAPLGTRRIATALQLTKIFSLTAAEARLARALAHGMRLEDYAIEHSVRLPTVKSQLRSVFAKTNTARQAELVQLIVAIPTVRA